MLYFPMHFYIYIYHHHKSRTSVVVNPPGPGPVVSTGLLVILGISRMLRLHRALASGPDGPSTRLGAVVICNLVVSQKMGELEPWVNWGLFHGYVYAYECICMCMNVSVSMCMYVLLVALVKDPKLRMVAER